ncbi:MAG: hypothetical protein ACOYB3_01430 [Azonexus sp.]
MNPSRIGIPINKKIDEWMFHFNGKAVKFVIHIKRQRDPEGKDSHNGLLKLATFHAYLDKKYLRDHGIEEKELGFPTTPVSGHDYNEVFEKVKNMVWSAKDQAWLKVIAVAVRGSDRMNDEDKVKFAWGVGLRSTDGTLFKTLDSRNYVSRRPAEIIPGTLSFEQEQIKIYPYTEEMEASLKELDAMFIKFTGALRFVVNNPEMLIGIKNRLLPLTFPEEPVTVAKPETTVNGIRL